MSRSFGCALVGSIAMSGVLATSARAQSGGQAAFVYVVGNDTIGIERFMSSPQLLTGEVLLRGQPRVSYIGFRSGGGRFRSLDLVVFPANSGPDATPLQRTGLRMVGDTAIAETTAGGTSQTQRLATKSDALLVFNGSIAMFEPGSSG